MKVLRPLAFFLLLASSSTRAAAQTPILEIEKCEGPIYARKDVDRPAKIIFKPEPGSPKRRGRTPSAGR